jgi:geranylgeranyl pyrophosphate synthase
MLGHIDERYLTAQPFSQSHRDDHTVMQNKLQQAITQTLPDANTTLHDVAHFHFDEFGKLLRGRTALAVSAAVDFNPDRALQWALAVELMHNASLVHDDICDQDEKRRDQQTIFSAFGTPLAICFGDWLVAKSFEAALAAASGSSSHGFAAISSFAKVMARLSIGQADEFTGVPVLTWPAYEQVVCRKTVPLILAPIEGPLQLAGQVDDILTVRRAIRALGIAYQMANDILDVLGEDGRSGTFGDLHRRAPNAVLVSYRNQLVNGSRAAFDAWMAEPTADAVPYDAEQMITTGALDQCARRLQDQIDTCERHCADLPLALQTALAPLLGYLEKTTNGARNRAAENRCQ